MTHEYTLLTGGIVLPGAALPEATAIAWAGDSVLALGTDAEVRAISRGDSRAADLGGACVVPLSSSAPVTWPTDGTLEIGGRADLAILRDDPRRGGVGEILALVRGGRVVAGALPDPGAA